MNRARQQTALQRPHRGLLAAVCLLVSWTTAAEAEVKVKKRADGRITIVNETPAQRQVRTSGKLRPIQPGGELSRLIHQSARQEGLSPRLVQSVVQVESGYNVRALSHKGAQGLMQLMPATARELGVEDAYDARQNLEGGARYLRQQLERFDGDLTLALAAYNAGPTAVQRFGGIPPYRETRNYVQKVLSLYRGSVPQALREQAQTEARLRRRAEAAERQREQANRGAPIHVRRGENNRILFTNSPPKTSSPKTGSK